VALTDEALLDFDHKRLAHFDAREARRTLTEQRDVFRAQLVAARWIDGWRERMADRSESPTHLRSPEYDEGYHDALREVAAHLRQGDLIPGGILHDETDDGRL
jgi:hypothetical protein